MPQKPFDRKSLEQHPGACPECGFVEHEDYAMHCERCGKMIQWVNFCANEKCWRNVGPDRYALSIEADFCPDCGIMTTLSHRRAVEFFTSTK